MVASAVYVLDLKGKVIISRNYRGDIPPNAVEKFMTLLQEAEDSEETPSPIMIHENINYLYIKYNNLYRKYKFHSYASLYFHIMIASLGINEEKFKRHGNLVVSRKGDKGLYRVFQGA